MTDSSVAPAGRSGDGRADPLGDLETLMVDDVLIFHSQRFSLDPPLNDRGIRYDLPLGDDLAAELKSGIKSRVDDWSLDDPVREDFGTVLMLRRDKVTINITVIWGPILDRDDYWIVQFHQSHGCLGLFLPRRDDEAAITEVKQLVNSVVTEDSGVYRDVCWIDDAEFRRIY